MAASVGIIFYSFEAGKVKETRLPYTEGMSVPENAVGHKFLRSRNELRIGAPATYSEITFYGAVSPIEELLEVAPRFANIDKARFQGVIFGATRNEFIAVTQADKLLPTRPTTV